MFSSKFKNSTVQTTWKFKIKNHILNLETNFAFIKVNKKYSYVLAQLWIRNFLY